MKSFSLLLLLATILNITCHASTCHGGIPLPIDLLQPQSVSDGRHRHHDDDPWCDKWRSGVLENNNVAGVVSTNEVHCDRGCESWRFAMETNNIRDRKLFEPRCLNYIGRYMCSNVYKTDVQAVINEAIKFAKTVERSKDDKSKDVWIFDIDETSLSNVPFMAEHNFGLEMYDKKEYLEWSKKAEIPAIHGTLQLYKELIDLEFTIVIVSGKGEERRNYTVENLIKVGYEKLEMVLLKGEEDRGIPSLVYKSKQRKKVVDKGYRIVGNIGDQWSDLLGTDAGIRTFKLPNPVNYVV